MNEPVPCGIRNINLKEPLPSVVAEQNERALLILFWRDKIPVGSRLFLDVDLPVMASSMPSVAAAACAPVVSQLDIEDVMTGNSEVSASDVSVIVCTRNRPEHLLNCISALSQCEPGPGEIIVVDNSDTPGSLDQIVKDFPMVRIVHEDRKGLSFARNTGLATATKKIVAFTDDDVEVTTNWVEALTVFFTDPEVGAVTGPVLPGRLQTESEFAFEFDLGGLASSLAPRSFDKHFLDTGFFKAPPVWDLGAGANLSIRKSLVDEIGSFDERLGAGAAGCSEDSEFLYRLLSAGWVCRYRPEVVVHHNHRGDLNALRRQMRAYMRGHVAALFVQFKESRHIGNLARVFIGIPKYHFGGILYRIADLIGFGWLDPWGKTAHATRMAQARGSVEGLFYLLRQRGTPKFSKRTKEPLE